MKQMKDIFLLIGTLSTALCIKQRFIVDSVPGGSPFQVPGNGGAPSSYTACSPQQLTCSLNCPSGYVKGVTGCDYCQCQYHYTTHAPATTAPPAVDCLASKLQCARHCGEAGYEADPHDCTYCHCKTLPPAATLAALTSTVDQCFVAKIQCHQRCSSLGYTSKMFDCTGCICTPPETTHPTTTTTTTTTTTPAPTTMNACELTQLRCSTRCSTIEGYIGKTFDCTGCVCLPVTSSTQPATTTHKEVTSPPHTTVSAQRCLAARMQCATQCGLAGYMVDPADCLFCACKQH